MKYAKIIVKNNYERRGDLVLRSYIRALKIVNAERFLDGDSALIYGIVSENGNFFEMFTREKIDYDSYVIIDQEEYLKAYSSKGDIAELSNVVKKVLFNKDVRLNISVSSIDELTMDNTIEYRAYLEGKSLINPFQRMNEFKPSAYLHEECNNFLRKVEELKKLRTIECPSCSMNKYNTEEKTKVLVRK